MEPVPFDIAIGLDRSDKTADLHLIQVKDAQAEHQRIETHPEALQDWVTELQTKYPGQRVAICVEQPANTSSSFCKPSSSSLSTPSIPSPCSAWLGRFM
jgi:hypothetical protein